jgi:hypothetical protein
LLALPVLPLLGDEGLESIEGLLVDVGDEIDERRQEPGASEGGETAGRLEKPAGGELVAVEGGGVAERVRDLAPARIPFLKRRSSAEPTVLGVMPRRLPTAAWVAATSASPALHKCSRTASSSSPSLGRMDFPRLTAPNLGDKTPTVNRSSDH